MKKYKVKLISRPKNYLKSIAYIKHTLDIKLAKVKELVDNVPTIIAEFDNRKDAESLKVLLKDCGGDVSIIEDV
nr:MAG TPA: 50S ribosomal protein L11 [Caudoviricetes sp.]